MKKIFKHIRESGLKAGIIKFVILIYTSVSIFSVSSCKLKKPLVQDLKPLTNGSASLQVKMVGLQASPDTIIETRKWIDDDIQERRKYVDYIYPLTQYYGIHIYFINDTLSAINEAKNPEDLNSIITSMETMSDEFDGVIRQIKENFKKGIIPPQFIINQIIDEIKAVSSMSIESNPVYIAFMNRIKSFGNFDQTKYEELHDSIDTVIEERMYPVYHELKNCLEGIKKKASNTPGVWRFENGDEYYRYMLYHNTTLRISPEDIHQTGLKEVERVMKEMDNIFEELDFKGKGTLENMELLNVDKRFIYPDDDNGKVRIIRDYGHIIDRVQSKLPQFFDFSNVEDVRIEPVPDFMTETSPQAYYYPDLDNSNAQDIFYVNLNKPTFSFDMESIAFHEVVPGHHFQMVVQRRLLGEENRDLLYYDMPAYVEGWALYSEKLADEYGFYDDSYSRLGYLRGELLRALRLVVDTGIHYKKWTREYAISYMASYACIPSEYAASEVDRYIANPGQACSYKIGQLKILELREKAKKELGDKFNIMDFHNVILRNGPTTLGILEKEIEKYIDYMKKS